MLNLTQVVETFPSVRIPSRSGGLDVEVSLIAQLGHGAGNHLYAGIAARQEQHATFIDELDEPSAKLASTDFSKGDATALYSFLVGPQGHPFHRHAGHRIFTAVSCSGGSQLRFSTASLAQIEQDPQNFLNALHFVNIPPDCLFTVRFGGETWHQFFPLTENAKHPVFFALSCHTNELGGDLAADLKEKVLADQSDIPSLTELLPPAVLALLATDTFQKQSVPTTTLALDAPASTFHRLVCDTFRSNMGHVRGKWARWTRAGGFRCYAGPKAVVTELQTAPAGSLLQQYLADTPLQHEDTFCLSLKESRLKGFSASQILAMLLDGFMLNAPRGVGRLMALRNMLVRPLGLRTSPLGCPVSSLLSPDKGRLFANKFPVLDQAVNADDTHAQVMLGANDKHLVFRSCVGVRATGADEFEISLGTRVHCKNLFGHFYMSTIRAVHRKYIAPTMLRMAIDYAVAQVQQGHALPVTPLQAVRQQ